MKDNETENVEFLDEDVPTEKTDSPPINESPAKDAAAEAKPDDEFTKKLRAALGLDRKVEMLPELKVKIKIKLEKFGSVIATTERAVYTKFGLNEPLLTPEEVEADYRETKEDFEIILKTRTHLESEYGDLINAGIDLTDHLGKKDNQGGDKQRRSAETAGRKRKLWRERLNQR